MIYAIKLIISALTIVVVSELSKRSGFVGGLIASLPLVSILGMIWLYLDTHDGSKVAALSISIFWFVLPSLSLFLVLPWLLKKQIAFPIAMPIACIASTACYFGATILYSKLGIKF